VQLLEDNGLRNDAITVRMTGCPNGCARPYIAELAFVGRSPGIYNMYLGGGFHGQRLVKLYKEAVNEEQIIEALAPVLRRYATERQHQEHFGDFCIRVGLVKETREGRDFHA
jgi:sulfite reductase (NADPH) hemoprotein beta-component